MASKIIFQDPLFNEFVFDIIVHSTTKERAKLTDRERRNLKSATTTKHYVNKTTIDEKLLLLQKLGVSYSLVVHQVKTLFPSEVKRLFKQHKKELTEDTITDLLHTRLFVISDKRVSSFLNLMDAACHSGSYMLNRDFYILGNELQWQNEPYPTNEEIKEGYEHMKLINKFMLSTSNALKDVQGISHIADLDLKILMYLFLKKDRYVSRAELNRYFRYVYKMTLLAASIKRLNVSAHLEQSPKTIDVSYMITGTGIDIVLSFMRKVMTDTLEY